MSQRIERFALAAIVVVAAVLLFWRLSAIYLWQDEANTAVLAVRMLKFGKPLAYDGVNLLTNDSFAAEDQTTIANRTTDPAVAVEYVIRRGDLKADGSWIFHPWGQFIVAAASIKAFGPTTLAARLPFAVAAFASVLLLYWLVRRSTGKPELASLACALLLVNPYWIIHSRQARYYALSSLCLLLTLLGYERWHRDDRWGAAAFVAAAWVWFQVDYGTWWPVLAILFVHALTIRRRKPAKLLQPTAALAVGIVPFLIFYQLWGRLSVQQSTWNERFVQNLFNMDRFVVSAIVLAAALIGLVWRRTQLEASERRLIGLSVAILCALLLWVPTVAPISFLRYAIIAAPLGCIITAWLLQRAMASLPRAVVWTTGAMVAFTPWLSKPFDTLAPVSQLRAGDGVIRPELSMMIRDIFVPRPDPNRLVVQWLQQHAVPTDEILVNYEDLPLMYYLPNPIRGGIAAFRAEDDARAPPAFIVLRQSVGFVHWPVFVREADRHLWEKVTSGAPDVMWGNNPDPVAKALIPDSVPDLLIARRMGTRIP
jgi:hypothetical protein